MILVAKQYSAFDRKRSASGRLGLADSPCEFNRSTQHFNLLVQRRSVADETKTSDLLRGCGRSRVTKLRSNSLLKAAAGDVYHYDAI